MRDPANQHRSKPSTSDGRVKTTTRQRHTNEVRGIGGAISTKGGKLLTDAPVHSVTATSTSANNGDWTGRITRKNPGVDRRMSFRFVDPSTLR